MNLQNRRPGALRRLASRALTLPALALAAWACQDTTGPAVGPDDGAAPRLGQASAYHCSTAFATPQGVQRGQFPLHFPPEALAADGSTIPYLYRHQTPSGVLTYSADCVIPRTVSAVEMMNRRFQVPPELGAPRGRSRDGGEFTIQGCVEEGACELEPIVVVAPAPPSICSIYCGGGGGPGGSPGWDGGSSGGGGGGDSDPSGGGNTAGDDTNFDCHTLAGCQTDTMSVVQRKAMRTAIETYIDPTRCPQVYNAAVNLVATARVWEQKYVEGSTIRGDYNADTKEMHVWSGNFSSPDYWLPWTIAHEATHAVAAELWLPTHQQVHDYGDSCLKFEMRH